jgi:predicted nucleic acid-binding protein
MPFVLDASVTAAWLLPDEAHPLTERVLDMLAVDEALVPRIWWFEIRNLLLVSERRGRLLASETKAILTNLSTYPIHADDAPDEIEVLRLARDYYMTFYDASYVELALRLALPIATLDRRMANAAAAELVRQIPHSGH